MPISFSCEFCRKGYSVDDSLVGRKVRCKDCGCVFRVPPPTHPTAGAVEDPYGLNEAIPPRSSNRQAAPDAYGWRDPTAHQPPARDDEYFAPPPRLTGSSR